MTESLLGKVFGLRFQHSLVIEPDYFKVYIISETCPFSSQCFSVYSFFGIFFFVKE